MFALKSRAGGGPGGDPVAPTGGLVLPRWLRRPARAVSRIDLDRVHVPRFAVAAMTAALFAATAAYGVVVGGHAGVVVKAVTAEGGFAVNDIRISGNRETSEIDVIGAIDLDGWTSLVGFDARAARDRVAALPWVESASVRKIYPNTVEVVIKEKRAFAIWQHGRELSLIRRSGEAIVPFNGGRYADLPLVVGPGAAQQADSIVSLIDGRPGLAGRVKGYVRVADRRWDLRLENGVAIKLPEAGVRKALDDLLALDTAQGVLSRDVVAIDLRLEDRLVMQLSPDAASRREAALKQRGKDARAAGRRI